MKAPRLRRGPFRADQLRDGDPYELSDGYSILVLPSGGRGAEAAKTGAAVLASDPLVESAGADAGYSPEPGTLRAPDIAVGNVPRTRFIWVVRLTGPRRVEVREPDREMRVAQPGEQLTAAPG